MKTSKEIVGPKHLYSVGLQVVVGIKRLPALIHSHIEFEWNQLNDRPEPVYEVLVGDMVLVASESNIFIPADGENRETCLSKETK